MEIKTTLKGIKNFNAVDVTNWNYSQIMELRNCESFRTIAYSTGEYGLNGLIVLVDNQFYKVCCRCSNLFVLV